MSHSILNADRGTHLKVVAIALSAAIVVLFVGVMAKPSISTQLSHVPVKASPVTTFATQDGSVVR